MNSGRTATVIVDKTLPQMRMDTYLRGQFPAASRGSIQRLIEQGYISVNGKSTKPTSHPIAGDVILVNWPEPKPSVTPAQEMPLDLLYEDDDLLVVNKPAGLVVHPGAGHDDRTLVNALLHHCKGTLSGIGGVARPGIVHRLDKDTSGCLVVAKNDPTHLALSKQFAERTLRKVYHAMLCGGAVSDSGDIRGPIGRHPTQRKRMTVTDRGREAWTGFRILERLPYITVAEAFLHTGRTHQIRVHFQYVGVPLLGDLIYGKGQNAKIRALVNYAAPRQMLHASELSFRHPTRGKEMEFRSPIPADFDAALRFFRTLRSTPSASVSAGTVPDSLAGGGADSDLADDSAEDGDLEMDSDADEEDES